MSGLRFVDCETHRRGFLRGAGASVLAAGIPSLSLASAPTNRRFVLVILRGGLDGLAAVPPIGDPHYGSLRGELSLEGAPGLQALDGLFALHPALSDLWPLWQAREMLVLQATGLSYRGRSHFDAQNALETGGREARTHHDGWVNRALAMLGPGGGQSGLAVAPSVPLALMGEAPVTSWSPDHLPTADADYLERLSRLYVRNPNFGDGLERAIDIRQTASAMDLGEGGRPKGGLRGKSFEPFAKGLGRLLAAPDGPRIAVTETGGWDTHARQGAASGLLARRLDDLAGGLLALKDALGPVWTETVVVVVSEFGRTVRVNGSGGTDHGTGGVGLVLGGRVAGGRVLTDWPGLAPRSLLDGRDLRPTHNLVGLFKAILDQHLNVPGRGIDRSVFPGFASVSPTRDVMRA